jgi:hypothetical protein
VAGAKKILVMVELSPSALERNRLEGPSPAVTSPARSVASAASLDSSEIPVVQGVSSKVSLEVEEEGEEGTAVGTGTGTTRGTVSSVAKSATVTFRTDSSTTNTLSERAGLVDGLAEGGQAGAVSKQSLMYNKLSHSLWLSRQQPLSISGLKPAARTYSEELARFSYDSLLNERIPRASRRRRHPTL